MPGSRLPQFFLSRQATFKNSRSNQPQRHTKLHSIDYRPFACTFLSGCIQYFIYQITARLIFMLQDISSNFNKIATQFALIPLRKDRRHFSVIQLQQVLHHPIGFRNKLHIAIFDAIMNHLDKMSRTGRSHPLTARRAVGCFGSNTLQNRLHFFPGAYRTARHDRSSIQCTLFTAGNTCSHKTEASRFGQCHTAIGIFIVGITAVYQYISRREQRKKLLHQFVYRTTGTNHHHYLARNGYRLHKTSYIRISFNTFTLCASVYKTFYHTFFNPRNRTVINRNPPALVRHIQCKILAHHGQPYQSNVCFI